jgi:hypothetical protein
MDVYHIVSWLGWTGNLMIAELLIYFTFKKATNTKKSTLINRGPTVAETADSLQ